MTTRGSSITVTETLHEGEGTLLLRGLRTGDGCPVLLRVLDPGRSRSKDLERLKNENAIGRTPGLQTVLQPLSLETYQGMTALVMEDFGGQPLDQLLGAPMAPGRFLELALPIVVAVSELHERDVIHKDLKPQNIFIHAATGEVKLTGLGLASRLPREHLAAESPSLIEGSLPYLAPEQTGRMNRAIDSRADLYALGVTFYEMLTGRLPFEARDALEWVHCHVARAPVPPSALVPELPAVLSAIVLKLLAKMAEDRYQTARGLRHDLERCLADWRARGRLESFPLATQDVSGRFEIPQKLYGREAERAALLAAFERVVDTGSPELVLVSGYSGIGKSMLVHELHKPIVRERGFFISGKFDPHQRDIPYSTLVQAFRELVLDVLARGEERIAVFRQRLLDALGVNARLILEVLPSVELIVGPQPPAPELPPAEAQHRFRLVWRRFIGVFSRKEHPLALFLDDLQWADSASLALLQDVMTDAETRSLLVIGAYRDNEVPATHPLMLALDRVRKEGVRVSDIVLGPLSREHLVTLVSETLHCGRRAAGPLADLVHEKTAGNPFFALQFLEALHDEQLIAFDRRAGVFRWDMGRIRAKGFTDNVVSLMVGKLARLPASTRDALTQLACLGSTAEVALLMMLHGCSEEVAHEELWDAVRAGLVFRTDGTYKFLHDRIQEAAYSLIPEGTWAAVHLRIGRLLSSRTAPEQLEEKVFDIVNQLDRGAALLTSREERERVAELNLIAGRRARRSAAYASALKYLAAGAELLPEDSWERRYALTFELQFHRAECEYLTGELGAAKERLELLSRRAANLVDVAAVTCARVALYTTLDRSDQGVEVCLDYLRRVGITWSPHPAEEEVQREHERIWRQLGSRSIEELVDLPRMTDPVHRATMDVLTSAQSPALFTDKNLLGLVVCRMANLSLEHGNSDASCLAYVWLGMLLGPFFGDFQRGYRFGKLGFDLLESRGPQRLKARVYLGFGHRVSPWTRHLRTSPDLLRRGFEAAQETGDLTYAAYTLNCLVTLLLARGDPLAEVQREAEGALEFARRARFGLIVDIVTGQLRFIRTLRGLLPDFASFNDAWFDEARFEQHLEGDARLAIATCWYYVRKLQARLYAGDTAGAVVAAEKAERLLWSSTSFFEVAEYHFHAALARAAHHAVAPVEERPRHLAALTAHHRQLVSWAKNCPENFGHRAALVAAELARLEGRDLDAERYYEEAIRQAGEQGFVQDEALAYELAARAWRARGRELIAGTYLREARARYLRWGADGKVRQLDASGPRMREPQALAPTATLAVRSEQLDLLAVAKASLTLSSELEYDRLVRTLLSVVLEQGGAQRAVFILCDAGRLSIEAEATLGEREAVVSLHGSAPVEDSPHVPVSVLRYVQRTKQHVILADAASAAGRFSGDDYFARTSLHSVLCMPILRQAETVGLLYLENGLLVGAFTAERLVALELLATQAAISLEKVVLLGKEQAARAEAEAAERRAAFLAESGALLSESLDYADTLVRLGHLCVRSLADWCVIDVVEGEVIQRISGAHHDPAKEPLLEELRKRYPPRLDSRHPAARVLREGVPLLFAEFSDADTRRNCEDEEHARLILGLGIRSLIVVPLVARGQTLGALSLVSSAPGRRYGAADLQLAREVARRAAVAIDNARLYRKTQEAIQVRDEFLSVASHELNTPMTSLTLALQSMARVLQSGRAIDPQLLGRLVERALRQGARLRRLNRDLLDVTRVHARWLPLDLDDVELGGVVREVLEALSLDLSRAGCTVLVREGGRVVGRWDRDRIVQILTSLLSNAIKFGAGRPIEVSFGAEAGLARVSVRDQGIGIDPARRERIFERFERAVSDKHYGGLGLGLYLSRRLAEAHGGTIRLQSEPGTGSTFTLELPCAGPSATVAEDAHYEI
ncbi:AAA family ATPase [Pyxidicoccus xibeiensis]|uniref:AAA family ATPase n=1 Tax=Pyxidicoccus xibeiensis TaxID=2906759 RepID=UPI0020A804BE|nr:AAA family ATPase [Pyxidicoccus xibeiensis]MCP3140784.1 AAA family ATPase [Pyxidicoccus xibeiensis]